MQSTELCPLLLWKPSVRMKEPPIPFRPGGWEKKKMLCFKQHGGGNYLYSCQDQLDKYGHQWHKEVVAEQLLIRETHRRTLMPALMKKCKRLIMKPYISLKRHSSSRFQTELFQSEDPGMETHTPQQQLPHLPKCSSSYSPFPMS